MKEAGAWANGKVMGVHLEQKTGVLSGGVLGQRLETVCATMPPVALKVTVCVTVLLLPLTEYVIVAVTRLKSSGCGSVRPVGRMTCSTTTP